MTTQENAMYTVPKLEDFSPSALDAAARDLKSALQSESAAIASEAKYARRGERMGGREVACIFNS